MDKKCNASGSVRDNGRLRTFPRYRDQIRQMPARVKYAQHPPWTSSVPPDGQALPEGLELMHETVSGRLRTLILRGRPEETLQKLAECQPLFLDAVPLSLEEIFIYELGGADYAVKDILL